MATSSRGKSGATGTTAAKKKAAEEAEQEKAADSAQEPAEDTTTGTPDADTPDNAEADSDTEADSEDAPQRIGAALTGELYAAAAPMTPPNNEAAKATWPVMGRLDSSNDPVSANAALRTPSGSTHKRLVDETGTAVDLNTVFSFPPAESPSMVATVTKRVYEEFRYPNTTTPTTHLLYPAGAIVPIPEALRVKNTYQYAPADEIPDGT